MTQLVLLRIGTALNSWSRRGLTVLFAWATLLLPLHAEDASETLTKEVRSGMLRAATYFRTKVARHGGYVYYSSPDGQERLGEGVASPDQIWVQPPGTPAVGLAYLKAYEATGEKVFLDAAVETAEALLYGQLKSGGWRNSIDFDPKGKLVDQYRNGKGKGKNQSTLDDGSTQTALQFLIQLDRATDFKNAAVHDGARFGMDGLLSAQFANGAFPQIWTGPSAAHPLRAASYPDYDWRTEYRIKEYWNLYTLNDQLAGDVLETLVAAHEVYKETRYLDAIRKLGDFLILAQMPDPQPAWSQQYSYDMHPCWARKFEPPAITGSESQDVIEALMEIYRQTGDRKYLAPIPKAMAYLKSSLLPDGQLARFYELKSNKPLYMTRNYELTYDDGDVPQHYGWKIGSRLDRLQKAYDQLAAGKATRSSGPRKVSVDEVKQILGDLDAEGRWLSTYDGARITGQPKWKVGDKYISSQVFNRNMERLSDYLISSGLKN
jgi:PelA/Pel-15E family pectate lyase